MARFLPTYLILCGVFLLHSCSPPPPPSLPPPNIIWLVAEDIGPSLLACYGDSLGHTPNIDRLAQNGVVYDKAYATAPICAPSRSCLMTGLYATSLGTQHLRCEIPFPKELKTLPEYLAGAGYFTSNRNKTDYNFDPEGRWTHWSGSFAPWRNRTSQEPFFSFINVGPTHEGPANIEERYLQSIEGLDEDKLVDPQQVIPPPYYPDLPETRALWARYYNLLTAMDQQVGMVLDSLEADGLLENTLIFFFGDHGFGMPRYKRWLYQTGLHVPLVVSAPKAYAHLLSNPVGTRNRELVSFVDYVPTVLSLAGAAIPPTMEGQVFLGPERDTPRTHVFGARDRADDMFEMSRAVMDSQYIYIRHYMPHLPYIQPGFINSDRKDSYRILRASQKEGLTNGEQKKLWQPKPSEELYDLQADPQELNNLADKEAYAGVKSTLRQQLRQHLLDRKDLGLLTEAEYMRRAEEGSPYTYAHASDAFAVSDILTAAERVGSKDLDNILTGLEDPDSGVRYWAVMALRKLAYQGGRRFWEDNTHITSIMKLYELPDDVHPTLTSCLQDSSPSVQILTAETLAIIDFEKSKALKTLDKWVKSDDPRIALEAARAIQLIGSAARPLIPTMYEVLEENLGEPDGPRKYKDFNYAAFTSWALEWALKELGEEVEVN